MALLTVATLAFVAGCGSAVAPSDAGASPETTPDSPGVRCGDAICADGEVCLYPREGGCTADPVCFMPHVCRLPADTACDCNGQRIYLLCADGFHGRVPVSASRACLVE
jgi:hypothetical protein